MPENRPAIVLDGRPVPVPHRPTAQSAEGMRARGMVRAEDVPPGAAVRAPGEKGEVELIDPPAA